MPASQANSREVKIVKDTAFGKFLEDHEESEKDTGEVWKCPSCGEPVSMDLDDCPKCGNSTADQSSCRQTNDAAPASSVKLGRFSLAVVFMLLMAVLLFGLSFLRDFIRHGDPFYHKSGLVITGVIVIFGAIYMIGKIPGKEGNKPNR